VNTVELLSKSLQESRRLLSRAVRTCPVHEEITPGWTVREVVIHITGWDLVVDRALQAYLQEKPPYQLDNPDIDHSNQRMIADRKEQPLEEILEEWQRVRESLLKTLSQLSETDLAAFRPYPWDERGTLGEMVGILAEHERWHAEEIINTMDSS